ncbi:MAG: virulence RhuM family protein [Candidatus Helarchaeota archaeon]
MDKIINKSLIIRNSTAEFLIFQSQAKEDSIEVKFENDNLWLSQKMIAKLFDKARNTISEHLKYIFQSKELDENLVCRNFRHTAKDGKSYDTNFYNLKAIITVGYKVNSTKAVEFRQWATRVLEEFAIKGYVLDKERLKNGNFLNENYFKDLIEEIRDIRESERNFYQQITDIYTTAMDYNINSETTREFFVIVQNKLHYATHGKTAPELIMNRVSSKKEHMGLTTWKKAPSGKILKSDVIIAKNYLNKNEIKFLNRIVTMYLDYAEHQAEKRIPMTMKDWSEKLNVFLKFNNERILENAGKITKAIAREFAESEFEKYRIIQNKLFESDFDKLIKKTNLITEENKK